MMDLHWALGKLFFHMTWNMEMTHMSLTGWGSLQLTDSPGTMVPTGVKTLHQPFAIACIYSIGPPFCLATQGAGHCHINGLHNSSSQETLTEIFNAPMGRNL